MAIGPLARLWRGARKFLPWRRELGVWGVVLSAIHTGIILAVWVEWDLTRLFGFAFIPQIGRTVMIQHGLWKARNSGAFRATGYGLSTTLSAHR